MAVLAEQIQENHVVASEALASEAISPGIRVKNLFLNIKMRLLLPSAEPSGLAMTCLWSLFRTKFYDAIAL
jgi:hypothetical protein